MNPNSSQYSLTFHDTVPLPDDQLKKAIDTATKQKAIVLDFFKSYPNDRFTPYEVYEFFMRYEGDILLTSVRRCITNLTKEGRLIKCQWSESKEGAYGKLNRVWKYNSDYVAPLTYKGHKVYTADEINSMCITDVEFE